MHGYVNYELTNGDAAQLNQGFFALQHIGKLNLLPEDGADMEEPAFQYSSQI